MTNITATSDESNSNKCSVNSVFEFFKIDLLFTLIYLNGSRELELRRVSTLASPSKKMQSSGGLRRLGQCQVNNLSMTRTLVTSELAFCFAANIVFIAREFPLVTLEWPFVAVDRLVWLGSYSEYRAVLALVTLE